MDNLYEMKLNQINRIDDNWDVIRVPGGWIYWGGNSQAQVSDFVPFNNEFMQPTEH
jgi:hypothetical protein